MSELEPARDLRATSATIALLTGLAAGAAIAVLAFAVARYGPSGSDWSFRGNGALAAYALVPAFLAGGWTAVALRFRRRPWMAGGLAAAAVGVGLALLDAMLLPVFGRSADQAVGPIALISLWAWAVVAPALALWRSAEPSGPKTSAAGSTAAALLWAVGLFAGLIAMGFAVPAGS